MQEEKFEHKEKKETEEVKAPVEKPVNVPRKAPVPATNRLVRSPARFAVKEPVKAPAKKPVKTPPKAPAKFATKAPIKGLTAGRMVHYVTKQGEHLPGIITRVLDPFAGIVNLQVLTNDGAQNVMFYGNVRYTHIVDVGCWHFIEPA